MKEKKGPHHELVWMSQRRAKCDCGSDFQVGGDFGLVSAKDALLDLYNEHLREAAKERA